MWDNPFIRWNPEECVSLKKLTVSAENLWLPDIFILESCVLGWGVVGESQHKAHLQRAALGQCRAQEHQKVQTGAQPQLIDCHKTQVYKRQDRVTVEKESKGEHSRGRCGKGGEKKVNEGTPAPTPSLS